MHVPACCVMRCDTIALEICPQYSNSWGKVPEAGLRDAALTQLKKRHDLIMILFDGYQIATSAVNDLQFYPWLATKGAKRVNVAPVKAVH